jgi:hypothetical protein
LNQRWFCSLLRSYQAIWSSSLASAGPSGTARSGRTGHSAQDRGV